MASKDLADAKEHIASIGNILERAIVAQTLGSITELKVDSAVGDPAGGSSSSSTQMSPSTVSLIAAPQLIAERPLGLQRLHNELGAIEHAATHIQRRTHYIYSTHTMRATHEQMCNAAAFLLYLSGNITTWTFEHTGSLRYCVWD